MASEPQVKTEPADPCTNCDDGCYANVYCDSCDMWLCAPCYNEHNNDAPCHTPGCCDE